MIALLAHELSFTLGSICTLEIGSTITILISGFTNRKSLMNGEVHAPRCTEPAAVFCGKAEVKFLVLTRLPLIAQDRPPQRNQ